MVYALAVAKNRYPKWNPGKWNQRLNPADPWWLNFDPLPFLSPAVCKCSVARAFDVWGEMIERAVGTHQIAGALAQDGLGLWQDIGSLEGAKWFCVPGCVGLEQFVAARLDRDVSVSVRTLPIVSSRIWPGFAFVASCFREHEGVAKKTASARSLLRLAIEPPGVSAASTSWFKTVCGRSS